MNRYRPRGKESTEVLVLWIDIFYCVKFILQIKEEYDEYDEYDYSETKLYSKKLSEIYIKDEIKSPSLIDYAMRPDPMVSIIEK